MANPFSGAQVLTDTAQQIGKYCPSRSLAIPSAPVGMSRADIKENLRQVLHQLMADEDRRYPNTPAQAPMYAAHQHTD